VAVPNIAQVYFGIGKIIDECGVQTPKLLMQVKGARLIPTEGLDEYLAFELLLQDPRVDRRITHNEQLSFQLTCYSKDMDHRSDKKFGRIYELAALYAPILHQRDHMIESACVRFKECKIAYLDLNTSTFTARSISTGGTPGLHTQSAVILVDATIIMPKE
jgi:hypothetical protein